MGKNHRHKKNLKADKAKVHLKQSKTKFLPKGLNETKTVFKIKPIVLPQQLVEKSTDAPLSKRNLDVKDLCSRLSHYNENVRYTACEELAKMFKQFSEEIMKSNMSEIILKICSLMTDMVKKVRIAAVKVITVILEVIPSEKLEPFFKYFSTNMCCAMTSIHQDIQEDSLKFLDCFLAKDCGFISKTSEKLLPDFFRLISKLRSEKNIGQVLTLNLGSKMTTSTWRINVLSRLNLIFELILNNQPAKEQECIYSNAEECNTFPIYKVSFCEALNNPDWSTSYNSGTILDSYLPDLIPIFYEIWMEVSPQNNIKKTIYESTYLKDEAAAIFNYIVNSTYLLWKYVQKEHAHLKDIFVSKEATMFLNNLLASFPYDRSDKNVQLKRVKSNTGNYIDPICVKENLIICYIYFVLNATFKRNSAKVELESIAAFLNKCLQTKNYINKTNIEHFLDFISICLGEHCSVWKKSNVDARKLLENVINFTHSTEITETSRIKMISILSNFVDNPYLSKSSGYQAWLSFLPKLLLKPKITDIEIEILLLLARKGNVPFLTGLQANMISILENLPSLEYSVQKKCYINSNIDVLSTLKWQTAFLFYYMKDINCPELHNLLKHLSSFIPKNECNIIKEQLNSCKGNCNL
ncbi:testis-expressed protein 10 homolog [Diabrotica undecimpunctata]|uniref:testis-expressed protein 10 homolog n=1 Tax=Diabrotica undecimpunctata TaxID=50387 RepID=UPI003B631C5F